MQLFPPCGDKRVLFFQVLLCLYDCTRWGSHALQATVLPAQFPSVFLLSLKCAWFERKIQVCPVHGDIYFFNFLWIVRVLKQTGFLWGAVAEVVGYWWPVSTKLTDCSWTLSCLFQNVAAEVGVASSHWPRFFYWVGIPNFPQLGMKTISWPVWIGL